MKEQNPLFFLFKTLMAIWVNHCSGYHITSLGSLSGLLVPLFTGRLVDKFSVSSINWGMIAIFGSIFLVNALLSGIGLYLLSKIGEKIIYAIRSLLWEHSIKIQFDKMNKMPVAINESSNR